MLALLAFLVLVAVRFGVGTSIHLLWILAIIALVLWPVGFAFPQRGARCYYWQWAALPPWDRPLLTCRQTAADLMSTTKPLRPAHLPIWNFPSAPSRRCPSRERLTGR